MDALLEREAEALTRKVIEKALSGDAACLRLCVERLYPPHKPAPLPIGQTDETRVIDLKIFEHNGDLVETHNNKKNAK